MPAKVIVKGFFGAVAFFATCYYVVKFFVWFDNTELVLSAAAFLWVWFCLAMMFHRR